MLLGLRGRIRSAVPFEAFREASSSAQLLPSTARCEVEMASTFATVVPAGYLEPVES